MPPKRMTANPVRPARYRPGKPIAPEENSDNDSDSEADDSDSDASSGSGSPPPPPTKPIYRSGAVKGLKDVDLKKRFDEARRVEETRLALEEVARKKKAEQESDEYTTDEEGSGSGKSGSGESDSEEEQIEDEPKAPRRVMLRPTFIPKSKRTATTTTTTADPEEAARKIEAEERQRKEAEELLELHLKRDAEARATGRKGWDDDEDTGEGIDDTDALDPAAERAAWKLRELMRIKRERETLAAIETERAEIERRHEMDPALREKEDLEFVREQRKEKMNSRGKMGFMQKFYHKGAFYQEDDILKRDYATAEVEDSAKNREVLPKYMQVRGDEVGKRGRTRWTHLTAEDTSLQTGGSLWSEKKGSNNPNRFPIPAGSDERFMPDWGMGREGGRVGRNDEIRERGREVEVQRTKDRDGFGDRRNGERSRWDERTSRPRADGDTRRSQGDGESWSGDSGECRSSWVEDGRRKTSYGPRRDRGHDRSSHEGGSCVPGRDDDRERKRPRSPRDQGHEGEKRRRQDSSLARR